MKKKKLLIIAFLIVSMIMNSSMTVLATTVETISELEQNETAEEETEPELADFVVEDDTLPFLEDEKEEEQPEESVPEELVQEDTKETDADSQTENVEEVASESKEESVYEEPKVEESSKNVIKELSSRYTSKDGSTYAVTLTYGTDANIPDGSTLQVKEISEESSEYNEAREAVLADKDEKNENIDADRFNMVALDISIRDAKDAEIEPATPVSVEIKIESLTGVDDLKEIADSLEIQHHVENAGEKVIERVLDSSDELNVDSKTIETKFNVDSFSVFTITWTTGYGMWSTNNSATIHYGYMNNGTFTEFNNEKISFSDNFEDNTYGNNDYKFLIHDVEGYHYSNAYYRTNTSNTPATGATAITPLIREGSSNWKYYTGTNDHDIANNSHIYVLYEPNKDIQRGGTTETPETIPEGDLPDPPTVLKKSESNGDGTRTISLNITSHTKKLEVDNLADVIVVFDVSGSMSNNLSGGTSRLMAAKNAVNTLASKLLTGQYAGKVRMSLISFSTDAQVVQGFTTNYNTFTSKVGTTANSGLTASGGTNWEKALRLANEMELENDRTTFVIFVTDGNPTFRESRMEKNDSELDLYTSSTFQYYRNNHVFGTGSNDNKGFNYDAAVEQATSIVGNNKEFYAIAVSNDASRMQEMCTDSGVDSSHAYVATSASDLSTAFDNIAQSISGVMGYGAKIEDGITGLTNLEAKASVIGVDPNSFKHYKNGVEWDPTSEGLNTAHYNEETGAVEWNLDDNYQLEDNVTYSVSFVVWPSQEAIDIVTDLNNGEIELEIYLKNAKQLNIWRTKRNYPKSFSNHHC